MIDKIFSDDAYKQRSEFMGIDKENLLINCGIINTYFRYLDLVKKEKHNQETLLNKNEYIFRAYIYFYIYFTSFFTHVKKKKNRIFFVFTYFLYIFHIYFYICRK